MKWGQVYIELVTNISQLITQGHRRGNHSHLFRGIDSLKCLRISSDISFESHRFVLSTRVSRQVQMIHYMWRRTGRPVRLTQAQNNPVGSRQGKKLYVRNTPLFADLSIWRISTTGFPLEVGVTLTSFPITLYSWSWSTIKMAETSWVIAAHECYTRRACFFW